MALQAEKPVGHGIIPLAFQQGNRQKLPLGFAHLSGVGIQVMDVEPVVAPFVAQVAFGLGNFVGVVGEGVVNTAGVDVQVLAQVLHGNAGALDVPAGVAHTPGRVPLQGLILEFGLGEPEDEVVLVALVGILLHALPDAHSQILLVMVVEHIVFVQLGGIEVHVAPGHIGKALIQQAGNNFNVFVNTAGGGLNHIGTFDVQLVAVREKGVRIELRDFHNGLVLPLCALEHLILAGVGIGGKMAHIGDVHHPLDVVAQVSKGFLQHILHDVGAQVADVGIVVHRWAAGVHFHLIGRIWGKQFFLVRQGIVKIHG